MTASGTKAPGFSEAYNQVDSCLIQAKGLLWALGQTINLHPQLGLADDMPGEAIMALVSALETKMDEALSFQQSAWAAQGGETFR